MVLLLAVVVLAGLGMVLVVAGVTQARRERWLTADIAAMRRRAAAVAHRLPHPANDTIPLRAVGRRRRPAYALRR